MPFEKLEILTLVRKDEDQWWTMCNSRGQAGLVPAPYIERVCNYMDFSILSCYAWSTSVFCYFKTLCDILAL